MVRVFDCRRPASADQVTTLRLEIQDWAREAGLPTEVVDAVALAAYEAMANVVEHAYGDGDGSGAGSGTGTVDLHASIEDGTLTVTVADQGRWRPPPADPGLRGRGLALIEGLAGRATITPTGRGTTVRMRWPLSR
ncbi:MAG TPA: ATP-binding protein [Pseudonocardiaceae bacterium]|nr:ATP-binding protein [Pseudonocardiaceae bacterium]